MTRLDLISEAPGNAASSPMEPFDNLWYAVAASGQVLAGKRPFRLTLFDHRIVLWRGQDGDIRAIDDRCPHLGASLSGGRVMDGSVACPYHGLRFDGSGRCVHLAGVPRSERIPEALKNRSWTSVERDGWIFLLWGDVDVPAPALETLPMLMPCEGGARTETVTTRSWDAHYSRVIENALDGYHFWEVHRHWMRFAQHREDELGADREGLVLRNITEIDGRTISGAPSLLYPNLWAQKLGDFITISIAIVPESERRTTIHLKTFSRTSGVPLLRRAESWLTHQAWVFALWQDSVIVSEQTPTRAEDGDDVMLGYDRSVASYRNFRRSMRAKARIARGEAPEGEPAIRE